MAVSDIREQLKAKLDEFDEAQLSALLRYAEAMETAKVRRYIEVMNSTTLPDDYDEVNDPSIGFLSADPGFASRTEEILQQEFGRSRKSI